MGTGTGHQGEKGMMVNNERGTWQQLAATMKITRSTRKSKRNEKEACDADAGVVRESGEGIQDYTIVACAEAG